MACLGSSLGMNLRPSTVAYHQALVQGLNQPFNKPTKQPRKKFEKKIQSNGVIYLNLIVALASYVSKNWNETSC